MFDSFLRAIKDRVLGPVASMLGSRIHPNAISIVAWFVGIAAAVFATRSNFGIALVLLLANRVLDGFDGTVARVTGRQTDFGGYLDIVLDFSVYALIPIGLVIGSHSWQVAIAGMALLGSFYVNAASWMYLAAIMERRALGVATTGELTTITMPAGIIAGAESFAFYVLFLIFPAHLVLLFLLMSVLVLATVLQRLIWAMRALPRAE